MPRLLCIGECMIELASLGGDMFRKGFAGDTFNTAWYARAFLPEDWSVAYFTALGDDEASNDMVSFMGQAGVETGFIRRIPGLSPGLYMIHLKDGERSFSYWRSNSAAKRLADDDAALDAAISASDIVYFSGITLAILSPDARARLITRMANARAAGKLVAFDPNLRPRLWASIEEMRGSITDGARAASLVLPGFDDEAVHFGDSDVAATVARYRSLGVDTVLVKDGAKGATIAAANFQIHVPAASVETVVDTTSAGDSFNGGYLARLAVGDTPEEAARFAARVAAEVIRHRGALIPRQTLGL
ncbi:2-dehydro-3-deoxygluconokinase [Rhizobium sp. SG_E_25_P2]|uniref:sugar kinase n=1 Tax=Rhizobium sp. SG_E_25_P2 TaxID=2879942 RepID=UPI002474B49E|nr:sugar kinase [Rhizobium sp. SG_E_25_P2]MDH6267098.1 2-dehydro-3-deoxygluconokinase [Rhizobium sp. SG_E_25_P2]